VKRDAIVAIRRGGVTFVPPPSATAKDAVVLHRLFVDAIAAGARVPLFFATGVVLISLGISTLLPNPAPKPLDAAAVALGDEELSV